MGWEVLVWSAFLALSRQRSSGFMGGEPISVVDARAYLEAHGFNGRALVEALDMLIALDGIARDLSESVSKETPQHGKGSHAPAVR